MDIGILIPVLAPFIVAIFYLLDHNNMLKRQNNKLLEQNNSLRQSKTPIIIQVNKGEEHR